MANMLIALRDIHVMALNGLRLSNSYQLPIVRLSGLCLEMNHPTTCATKTMQTAYTVAMGSRVMPVSGPCRGD